ncbi:MAG: type II toxin-antitoxin system VapC family toxin [Candidatus Sumerlaeota bacterium]|nr:type II toxin-antitoxin system VapC family toxin [Candidatus Sumerlaeota bacterium]
MTGIILYDTDVLIAFLRGMESARRILIEEASGAIAACSAITVAEIRAGMKESEERATMQLLKGLRILPVDGETALLAGEMKAQTKKQILELDDCLIAATAIRHTALLVTRNAKHYPHPHLMIKQANY